MDIVQRAYSGLETRGGVLRFNPVLPKGLGAVEFEIRYRGHWLNVRITRDTLQITSRPHIVGPIRIALDGATHELAPGNTLRLALASR